MLSEKKIAFEVTEIDLKDKPDWFLKISPYGKVPVLKNGEDMIYESAIINEYLDEMFPEVPMLAATPGARAHQRIWIDFCNARMQPAMAGVLKATAEEFEAKTEALESALEMLEGYLERRGLPTPYFSGERLSLVDATYYPAFERFAVLPELRGYTVPERFARVMRWTENLAAHPAIQANAVPRTQLVANYQSFVPAGVRNVA